nr:GNAT family N-acetyltransferase [Alteromonas sp. ASW11-130]
MGTEKDQSNIADLHAQSWKENYGKVLSADYLNTKILHDRNEVWRHRLENPTTNQLVLVAEANREFCGFICAFGAHHPEFGTIIDNLHVKAERKGSGIGSMLLQAAGKWALEHFSEHDLYLEVLECNPKAIKFYERKGGKHIDLAYWTTPCGNKAREFIYSWGSPLNLSPDTI